MLAVSVVWVSPFLPPGILGPIKTWFAGPKVSLRPVVYNPSSIPGCNSDDLLLRKTTKIYL